METWRHSSKHDSRRTNTPRIALVVSRTAVIAGIDDRGPDSLGLTSALSALSPEGSEEKRLVDAILLAVRR